LANLQEQLLAAIYEESFEDAKRLARSGLDINGVDENGAPALYHAILKGNMSLVRLLLESGADPNFVADEPAASIYTEKPLELARQARFLMDWDKYAPIVKLLEDFGATDTEGKLNR